VTDAQWIFGYGSLVDPSSFGATIGRALRPGVDFFEAELAGYGRRWNYGVMHVSATGPGPDGTVIEYTLTALGLERAPKETVNGVVGRVEREELASLDARERHYERVDVTDQVTVHGADESIGPIGVYFPLPEAVAHYVRARDAGRAAIDQRYWDLVDDAFARFGHDALLRYRTTTPAPDVPVMPLSRR
jgi:cation transport regulator ChaC